MVDPHAQGSSCRRVGEKWENWGGDPSGFDHYVPWVRVCR
jgi:hypothetical protein